MDRLGWLILFAVFSVQAGDIYKWVDRQGQVHYSDRPQAQAEAVQAQLPPAADDTGLRPQEKRWLQQIERRDEAQARADEREQERETRQARKQSRQAQAKCKRYRAAVQRYENRLRAGCKAAACERYKAQRERYRAQAEQYCG